MSSRALHCSSKMVLILPLFVMLLSVPQLMDMRMTGIDPDDDMAIAENLRARQERLDKSRVLMGGRRD